MVEIPLICLIQFLISKGSTGHSQGIISSIVISGSSTEKEFIENSTKAVTFLYWLGLRSRNAFPITTIGPTILSDSLQNGEGVPSPMLSINGKIVPSLLNLD